MTGHPGGSEAVRHRQFQQALRATGQGAGVNSMVRQWRLADGARQFDHRAGKRGSEHVRRRLGYVDSHGAAKRDRVTYWDRSRLAQLAPCVARTTVLSGSRIVPDTGERIHSSQPFGATEYS